MSPAPTFSNSYSLTNREHPFTPFVDSPDWVYPLSPGALYFVESLGRSYDIDELHYDFVGQSKFLNDLQQDLARTVQTPGGPANLVVFIHGLGNTYDDAIIHTANLGRSLQGAGYGGLVIGFSWPSFSDDVALFPSYYATGRPPTGTSGTIRDNINGSVQSFQAMLKLLQTLQVNGKPVTISLICHSEGNFMLMWGMMQYPQTSPKMNNAIMLAADISAAMLQTGQWGQKITGNFNTVSVYFSGCDIDVTYSDYEFFAYHDQTYPTRLGQIGPFAYPSQNGIPSNVVGVDCSRVTVNLGDILNVHSSYFTLPSVLIDMTSVLSGATPTGRTHYPGSSYPWYYLSTSRELPEAIKETLWSGELRVRPRRRLTATRVRVCR